MGNQKDKKKDKNKIKEKDKNAKLQLKGRIFMTNVTDVVSSAKQGTNLDQTLASAFLTSSRIIYSANLLERRSWSGKFHNPLSE
jgi:hypothetical protein